MQKLSQTLAFGKTYTQTTQSAEFPIQKMLDILCEPILVVSAIGNAHLT